MKTLRPEAMPRARRVTCLAAIMAMIGGCAVGPNFVRPAPPDTDRYTFEPRPEATIAADGRSQRFAPGAALNADWWRLFGSAELDGVVQRALDNNPTLQAAEASLRQSQDSLRAGYGVFFPQAQAELDASRQRTAPLQQGGQANSTIFNLATLSVTISYALDVFGGQRRTVESLRAQAEYQGYEGKATYITLAANVVNTTIAQAAYAAQIRATQQLIELEKDQLRFTEAQVRAGTTSYVSVLTIRSLIAGDQASLAPLEQDVSHAEHLLATLQGVMPSKGSPTDVDLSALSLPVDLPVSLPSDLVNQRPDIRAAEAQMHVASAKIGVATAAMLPSITLSGTYGVAASNLGTATFWGIGPSVSVPVFQGGSLWYGRKAAIDVYQASQANYRQTVLTAFEQVADSLRALEHDAEALQAQVEARDAAGEALALVQANFQAGLVAYLEVLTADMQCQRANVAYLQAVAQRYQDTVALFVALGGGWWNDRPSSGRGEAP